MLLTDKNPLKTPIVFGGFSFNINMAFNVVLQALEVLDDMELTTIDRACIALYVLTGEDQFLEEEFGLNVENVNLAEGLLRKVFNELIVNEKEPVYPVDVSGNPIIPKKKKKTDEEDEEDDNVRSFDFMYDAEYIYSSFRQAYQMNLYDEFDRLHWFEFLALFRGLPSETMMMKVIDIRERPIPTGKHSQKEAQELRDAKMKFALPRRYAK